MPVEGVGGDAVDGADARVAPAKITYRIRQNDAWLFGYVNDPMIDAQLGTSRLSSDRVALRG